MTDTMKDDCYWRKFQEQARPALREDMQAFALELKADPVKAREFFRLAGILDDEGKLAERYRSEETQRPRVVNLFAGPGTGKSTTCAALFAELKYQGFNTEMVLEYAKDAAWERRGKKVFAAQEYIFGKQHFRLSRVAPEVDFVITDSPLLLSLVYMPIDFAMPALRNTVVQAFNQYDNLNVFLHRSDSKAYNPKGRNQSEAEAIELDRSIRTMLDDLNVPHYHMTFGRDSVDEIIKLMILRGWIL